MQPTFQFEPKIVAGLLLAAWLPNETAGVASSQPARVSDHLTPNEIVEKSRQAYASLTSYSDRGSVVSEMAGQKNTLSFTVRMQRPNQYRVEWALQTKLSPLPGQEGAAWCDGGTNYFFSSGAGKQQKNPKPQPMPDARRALEAAAGPSWSASLTIPGLFFHQNFQDAQMALVMSGKYPLVRENDGKIDNLDCYVISSSMDLAKAANSGKQGTTSSTLWIGKTDFLIHQARSKTVQKIEPAAPPGEQEIDVAIRKSLEMQNKPATPEAVGAMRPQMRLIMQQTQRTLKTAFESGVVTTQTHQNIAVNEALPPSTFTQ